MGTNSGTDVGLNYIDKSSTNQVTGS